MPRTRLGRIENHPPHLPDGAISISGNNNMVQYADIQQPAGFNQFLGEKYVFVARLRITGRMIMNQDNCGRTLS